MSCILITGGSGFIGRHLISHLKAQGHQVRCAVSTVHADLDVEQILIEPLEHMTDWHALFDQVDCVIHLAAHVHVTSSVSSDATFHLVNSEATKKLGWAAAHHDVKRFIFMSTIKVNGEYTLAHMPFTETDLPRPSDAYAKSKLRAEQYLKEISCATAMQVVILRPPLVYGPGVKANFLHLITAVKKRYPLPFSHLNQQRSMIYIDNLIHAIDLLTHEPLKSYQCFLVADDQPWVLPELIKRLAFHLNQRALLFPFPTVGIQALGKLLGKDTAVARLTSSLIVDNRLLKNSTSWQPKVANDEGLRQTIKWYQKHYHP
ncbi:MAG: NAD-dependent dehydratase [Legionellaceae bacterium]|mgnify:CR=1 FL=1|nr:NAD-dependent dehydratase [Legionellaceae bacterium]HAF87904.1 NAD-dependent dehydratase [Legionellales bacterium]HCA89041.1 NAD-dependent dehydratase [Legionellales bacterium]|tara:strand:- start:941 stop:1891 length:951 start_codon:yes stop_codon:yes gene_type:complete